MQNPKPQIIQQLKQIEAIQTGEFTLKSGEKSNIYVDLRRVIAYPKLVKKLVNCIWEKLQHDTPDLICGVPYGAIPYASVLSAEYNIPLLMMRKEAKSYGLKKILEGVYQPRQSCVLIEDVITTGGSLLKAADDVKSAGLIVNELFCLVDREAGAKEYLESKGYRVHALLTLSELLQEEVLHD